MPTGQYNNDVQRGRSFAALLLHVMREHDAPFLLHHVLESWIGTTEEHQQTQNGFCLEMADAVMAACRDAPSLQMVNNRKFPRSLRSAMLQLPFAEEMPDGSVNLWSVDLSGDYEARQDRGRHHGAVACQFIRVTGHVSLFAHINALAVVDPEYAELGSPYRVGFAQTVATVAISSGSRSTVHQRAMLPFYGEFQTGASRGDSASVTPVL